MQSVTFDKIIRLVTSRTDNYNLVQLKVSIFNNYEFLGALFSKGTYQFWILNKCTNTKEFDGFFIQKVDDKCRAIHIFPYGMQ